MYWSILNLLAMYYLLPLSQLSISSSNVTIIIIIPLIGEHQYELMDSVAAKFHEEPGVFKLMVCTN